MTQVILALINKFRSNWNDVYDFILYREDKKELEGFYIEDETILANKTIISEEHYYDKFKKMYMPPMGIFFKGNDQLLNTKIFSILGDVTVEQVEKLSSFKEDGYTICLSMDSVKDGTIQEFIKQGFKVIAITEQSYVNLPEGNENLVYVTEHLNLKPNKDPKAYSERIIYALSDKLLLTEDNKAWIVDTNYKNEAKQCFVLDSLTKSFELNQLIENQKISSVKDIDSITKK